MFKQPCVMVELIDEIAYILKRLDIPTLDFIPHGEHASHLRRFVSTGGPILSTNATRGHTPPLRQWLNHIARDSSNLRAYCDRYFSGDAAKVQWDDIRIRQFSPEERRANVGWLTANSDAFLNRLVRDRIEELAAVRML